MSKVAQRKAQLHQDLIHAAEKRIASDTVAQLRARDLAKDAGCSVGAIYNVVDDLDAIILHVSFRTLKRIDVVMEETGALRAKDEPIECMVQLALTYFSFVRENYNLWRALFDHDLPADYPLPDWVLEGQKTLFRHIERPLRKYMPDADDALLQRTARSLFASVHGVVSLSMEGRVSGISLDAVPPQLEFLLRTFVKGLQN
ncbi:TetR/AcrR family transcriptional regulator [Pseudahrensia aquimaris]|uniref:TetR/AcrR family transcriptional regulator n=1 Tax=Pseudahrensia aquimaris TaxID=744461 RepID=A0ABW3FER8_9HYPH